MWHQSHNFDAVDVNLIPRQGKLQIETISAMLGLLCLLKGLQEDFCLFVTHNYKIITGFVQFQQFGNILFSVFVGEVILNGIKACSEMRACEKWC